ncbi:MAG: hypothetical protein NVS9B4_01200 [Candidatus Acidiferrum sp.]
MDYNALADIVRWLIAHGAPSPTLRTEHASFPGGVGWDWTELVFENAGSQPYVLSVPTLMGSADRALSVSAALTEMQSLGIVHGDKDVRVPYTPPVPAPPPHPFPVDNVVGLPRADEPGAFDGATYFDWISYVNRKTLYRTEGGRKFKTEMRGSPMMALYVFVEV